MISWRRREKKKRGGTNEEGEHKDARTLKRLKKDSGLWRGLSRIEGEGRAVMKGGESRDMKYL